MLRWGITEGFDPCFDLSFEKRLCEANIIITKNVSKIHDILIRNKEKCILHATITGYGGTRNIEPNVPSETESYTYINNLIDDGFPKNQIVLRVDPIFPNEKGIEIAKSVITKSIEMVGIKRLRFSYLDMYPHVRKRFENVGLKSQWFTNLSISRNFESWVENLWHFDIIEACAENSKYKAPCISGMDMLILGIRGELQGSSNQRSQCDCPKNKTELLKNKKYRCPHQCLYCYWHDKEEKVEEVDLLARFLY